MDRRASDFGTFAKVPSVVPRLNLLLLLQMRNHSKPILPLRCNAIPTYPSAGGSPPKPSRFGDSFAYHPSIGGKQKLFVRRFVKGYSDESNEALIPFLQAEGFLEEVYMAMNNCSWTKSACVNKQKT